MPSATAPIIVRQPITTTTLGRPQERAKGYYVNELDSGMSVDAMKRFVVEHFDRLINHADMSVIQDNVRGNYVDHDGPDGQKTGVDQSRDRTAENLKRLKNLKVEIRDVLGDGDRVVVRNVWTAFDPDRGEDIEMHGFVLFRIREGRLAERWATITDPAPLGPTALEW